MKTSVIMRPIAIVVLPLLILSLAVSLGLAMVDAGASGLPGSAIVVPLPESDAAVQTDADGSCRFTGTDIQYIGQTGEPSIPCQSVRVLLPPDADLTTVEAKITGYRWSGIDGEWDVPPVPPVATGDGEGTCAMSPADEAIVNSRDAGIYSSDALFPIEPVRKVDVQIMRGWNMAQVFYAPFAYNPVEKKVLQLSGNAIEITFERTSLKMSAAGIDSTSADEVRDMTVNFAEVSDEYGSYAVSAGTGRYVIITTSAIQTASSNLDDFVASKEARGFTVQVVTEGTWGGGTGNTAAENLRSWLQANYLGLGIEYVLLIGNPNPSSGAVPMKMCYPQVFDTGYSECPTDFYYAELTSNWNADGDARYGEYYNDFSGNPPRAAEVAVGRIPYYGNITDLDHILSKIIDYETAPASSVDWRENALLPMEPSDDVTPGYQLGEEIKDDVLPVGWTYHRVYDQYNAYCDPDCLLSIPADTETKSCTIPNVTNSWNGSDFGAIFWWTHGASTSAADVMDLSHAATLDDDHPGFTFQCSCTNGMPEVTNNLGYSLLKNGCIATVSASRVSWYYVGQTSFAGTASNSGMTFEYARRLIADDMYAGDALNDLKFDVSLDHEVLWMNYLDFNLYGCPAVGLSTPPGVETSDATNVNSSSAQLNAELNLLGTADNVTVSFEWGLDSGYGNETAPQTKTDTGPFSANINGLTEGTTYHFRAKASGDGTAYGVDIAFSTASDTTAPARPWRVSPPNGHKTEDTTPSFDWSNVSDPTGVTYWLQIAYEYNFSSLVLDRDGLVTSDYTLAEGEALADGLHYWRVCAVDGLGNQSAWTSGWAITVDTTAPARPWRVSPPNGYQTEDTTPSFDWSNVSDPTGVTYRLQIAYNYSFSSLVLDKEGLTLSEYTLDELEALADGKYYWRVCAVDGLGHQSAWTSGWAITVDTTAPARPWRVSPPNGRI